MPPPARPAAAQRPAGARPGAIRPASRPARRRAGAGAARRSAAAAFGLTKTTSGVRPCGCAQASCTGAVVAAGDDADQRQRLRIDARGAQPRHPARPPAPAGRVTISFTARPVRIGEVVAAPCARSACAARSPSARASASLHGRLSTCGAQQRGRGCVGVAERGTQPAACRRARPRARPAACCSCRRARATPRVRPARPARSAGGQCCASVSRSAVASARTSMPSAPCPAAGSICAGSKTLRMRSARPRRFRPAAASTMAS